jgi:CTP:molybdopterin cytidylyltransferase MocA
LRSAPFTIAEAHLRFVLSGPADVGLRVVLLDQGKPVRTASPSGAATVVDWDTSELVGREVVLLAEDRSPTGGLAFDEVVTW